MLSGWIRIVRSISRAAWEEVGKGTAILYESLEILIDRFMYGYKKERKKEDVGIIGRISNSANS